MNIPAIVGFGCFGVVEIPQFPVSGIDAWIAIIPHVNVVIAGLLEAAILETGPHCGSFNHGELRVNANVAPVFGNQLLGELKFFAVLGIDHELHGHWVSFLSAGRTAMAFANAIAIFVDPTGFLQQCGRAFGIVGRPGNLTRIGRAEHLRPLRLGIAKEDILRDGIHINGHTQGLPDIHIRQDWMGIRLRIYFSFGCQVWNQSHHPALAGGEGDFHVVSILVCFRVAFRWPDLHVGIAFQHQLLRHRRFRHDSDKDLVDTRFTLLVVVGVANKSDVVAGFPLFEQVGSVAQWFAVAVPRQEALRGVTIVCRPNAKIFGPKLKQVVGEDAIVMDDHGMIVNFLYAVGVVYTIGPRAQFRIADGIPGEDHIVDGNRFTVGPEDIIP